METQIKLKIKELRDSGVGYGEIAKALRNRLLVIRLFYQVINRRMIN